MLTFALAKFKGGQVYLKLILVSLKLGENMVNAAAGPPMES